MVIGLVKSVEECLITVGGGQSSVEYTLTKGQNPDNCVPFATWVATTTSNCNPYHYFFDAQMLSGPARVKLQRGGSSETFYTAVYVVEFEPTKIKVQQGTWQIPDYSTTDTVTLGDSVTTDRTALMTYHRSNSTSYAGAYQLATCEVLSSTQIRMQRGTSVNVTLTGSYYVMEALNDEWEVSHYDSGAVTGNSYYQTITSVDTARTFLIGSSRTGSTSSDIEQWSWHIRLASATEVHIARWNTGASDRIFYQVVECADDSIFVQHRYAYGDTNTDYHEWTLPTPVSVERSIAHNPNVLPYSRTDGTNPHHLGVYRHYLKDDGATLRMERYFPSFPQDDCYFVGEVIEFTATEMFCEGNVRVDGTLTSGIVVSLYRRVDDLFLGSDTTAADGSFAIPSRFQNEYHYLVARSTVSGINAVAMDWLLAPTVS